MATTASPQAVQRWTATAPRRWAMVLLAGGGALTGVALAALAYTSDGLGQPGLHAALAYWITIPYIVAGLIAWRRRPDSRLGVLMVAAGFASFLNFLIWSNNDGLFTLGVAAQFLPPVLFLHVFLAFPTGRLESRLDRAVVMAAYGAAALTIPALAFAQESPRNVVALVDAPAVADILQHLQLLVISGLSLAGIAVLARRRRRNGRPLRPRCVVSRTAWRRSAGVCRYGARGTTAHDSGRRSRAHRDRGGRGAPAGGPGPPAHRARPGGDRHLRHG